tara:strand:+ start:502 stop:627 length:126 start_codon:yes stop_codon:yes gene_type:complete
MQEVVQVENLLEIAQVLLILVMVVKEEKMVVQLMVLQAVQV